MIKFCRIGHRTPNKGVITIASAILDFKIFYGVSYCSPKEKRYDKQLGNDLAMDDLEFNQLNDDFLLLEGKFEHANILKTILTKLYYHPEERLPKWASNLLFEQLSYPTGLNRFPKGHTNPKDLCEIKELVVETEYAKEQLLLALNYIQQLRNLDTEFVAVNELVRINKYSEIIVVKS